MSLFWRVFATNAALLVAAALVLGASPITVRYPIALTEAIVLGIGLVAMLVGNAVLLRPVFAPLEGLAQRMKRVDPLRPGERLPEAGQAEVAAFVRAFNEMLARLEAERRDSGRRALAAQESERERVASELHDEVGQTMTGVLLLLERLYDGVLPEQRGDLDAAREAVRSGLDEVRRIAQELRPEMLEHFGLVSALTALARGFSERTGITVERRLSRDAPALAEDAELVVYRVAQESLTNAGRHAEARRVVMSFSGEGKAAVLRVVDDGKGMGVMSVEGGGLRGMRERAVAVGAMLTVTSAAAGGVEVTLTVPAEEKR
ncbi:MAG: histidine kinase [Streptosporangiaceae bacterium]